MTAHFQFFMILGAAILLLIIFALLKKGQMSVKYSLLWLALAVVLVIFAVFPYVDYVLRDLCMGKAIEYIHTIPHQCKYNQQLGKQPAITAALVPYLV